MKYFWLFMFGLFFTQGCGAQSQLPAEMPEKIRISFHEGGGMMRAWVKIEIANGQLRFEELKGGQQNPQKWTAAVTNKDLAGLYGAFVANKFDTIKNDERKGIVYDAGSENIGLSLGVGRYFHVTYGKNSPLSGKNLERYQAVRKALDEFIARHQNRKTEISSVDDETMTDAEKRIQGTWRAEGKNGKLSWYLEYTFEDGNFKQKGYPPLYQEGKYRVLSAQENKITLALTEQKGTFGVGDRTLELILENESLTISGTPGFSRAAAG